MAATLLTLSDRFKNEPSMTPVVLDEILRETHQEVSGMIAQLWKLPAEMQNVLAHHHSFPAGEAPSRLSAVVAMVEELSHDLGHGVEIGPGRCDRVAPENLAQRPRSAGVLRRARSRAARDREDTGRFGGQGFHPGGAEAASLTCNPDGVQCSRGNATRGRPACRVPAGTPLTLAAPAPLAPAQAAPRAKDPRLGLASATVLW
jgi:hypothetical protein